MSNMVKTRLIKIGNSQGIRLSKTIIEQAGLVGELEIETQNGQLIIRSAQSPRQNWDAQFQAMASAGDDRLLDADSLSPMEWEHAEWEWS